MTVHCLWRTTTGRRVCLMGTLRHDCELRTGWVSRLLGRVSR